MGFLESLIQRCGGTSVTNHNSKTEITVEFNNRKWKRVSSTRSGKRSRRKNPQQNKNTNGSHKADRLHNYHPIDPAFASSQNYLK